MQISHHEIADGPMAADVEIASTPKMAQNANSAMSQNPNTFFRCIFWSRVSHEQLTKPFSAWGPSTLPDEISLLE